MNFNMDCEINTQKSVCIAAFSPTCAILTVPFQPECKERRVYTGQGTYLPATKMPALPEMVAQCPAQGTAACEGKERRVTLFLAAPPKNLPHLVSHSMYSAHSAVLLPLILHMLGLLHRKPIHPCHVMFPGGQM